MPLTKNQNRQLQLLAHRQIIILGAGREGLSTYRFLRHHFPQMPLAIADQRYRHQLGKAWREIFIADRHLTAYAGPNQYLQYLTDFDLCFRTPGISPNLPQLIAARAAGVEFSSNTALFLQLARGLTIGITGTKGKSTTASLIAHLLQTAGKKTHLVGNIGLPALDYLDQLNFKSHTILELSSHQLQDLPISPHIAILQNITSEHLDYYQTTKAYVQAKTALVSHQKTSDYLIYSPDFKTSRHFATLTKAHLLPYTLTDQPGSLAFAHGRGLYYRNPITTQTVSIADRKKIKLLGKHNLYNLLPALILAHHLNISNEQIATAFYTFTPLRHRLEYVHTVNDISYYNDSLSTTPAAASAALQTFPHSPIILLAGGYERHQDFTPLAKQILKSNLRALILFPPTGKRLRRTLIDLAIQKKAVVPQFIFVETMSEAINQAAAVAKPGDTVLLSPAAASFNQFRDYADRGDQFCQLVKNLL